MEGKNLVNTEIPVKEAVQDESFAMPVKASNGDLLQVEKERKKEEEETNLDGEFIKVEREAHDKDGSVVAKPVSEQDHQPTIMERSLSNSSRELIEAQEKMKELELELERVTGALKHSESENSNLKNEVLLAKEKLDEARMKHDELDLSHKKLQEHFLAAEQRTVELVQQINLVELKGFETEEELKEFSGKISELTTKLGEVEEEKKFLNNQRQEYQEKVDQLESALKQSAMHNSEIAEELKITMEKSTQLEDRANMSHQRSLELEDLFQTSHSKLVDADKKVNELDLLLQAEKYRIQELEEHISKLEKKCGEAEVESTRCSDKISELASQLEESQAKTSSLDAVLQIANEKEKELTDCLNLATDEKKELEVTSQCYSEKFTEAENLVEILRSDLNLTQLKLESIENDLKAVGLRESAAMEKLKSTEEQLEQHVRLVEQTSTRNSDLESLHKSLTTDLELKLQEMIGNFTKKDSEAKFLSEKLKLFEEELKVYEEQVAQAAGQSVSLKEELDQSLVKVASLESTNEQLREEMSKVENKALLSSSENELLVQTNIQLKSRVDELEELLNSAVSEKEITAQEIENHMYTIRELSDQHTRALELRAEAESQTMEAEAKLHDAIEKYTRKESEADNLIEKLNVLEGQIRTYQDLAHEASRVAISREVEVEETLVKLKQMESFVEELQTKSAHFEMESEGLAVANLKLSHKLAAYESKLSDLEGKLAAALKEKDETDDQLQGSKKAMLDLTQQITFEGHSLQSQISSLMEENNLLHETHQNTKKELQSVILQLEEQLKDEKENEESLKLEVRNLKAEIAESSLLQTRIKELEEQLVTVGAQLREEKGGDFQKELEREAALKHSLQELEVKSKEASLLQKQVKELQEKLQLAEAKMKVDGSIAELKDVVEVKSRDIDGATFSTPSKRKSKKKLEAASVKAASSSTSVANTEASPLTSLKLILGVAFVSIIIGVILGMRY